MHRSENPLPAAWSPVARHHPTGASTGVFAHARGSWPALVRESCAISSHACELSALSEDELDGLLAFLAARPRLPFRYLSVHAPVKGITRSDAELAATLARLPLGVRSIILHPDAISDPEPYRRLGTRAVIENMDPRKASGRTADELEGIFAALPDAGFCFDVAHADAVDPTLAVAGELLDRWRSRLRQVHLSSLADGRHVPLADDDERRYAQLLGRCRDVPWILEATRPERWEPTRRMPLAAVGELAAA